MCSRHSTTMVIVQPLTRSPLSLWSFFFSSSSAHPLSLILLILTIVVGRVTSIQCQTGNPYDQNQFELLISPTGSNCTSFKELKLYPTGGNEFDFHDIPILSMRYTFSAGSVLPFHHLDWRSLTSATFNGGWEPELIDQFLTNFSVAGTSLSIIDAKKWHYITIPSSLQLQTFIIHDNYQDPGIRAVNISINSTRFLSYVEFYLPLLDSSKTFSITTPTNTSIFLELRGFASGHVVINTPIVHSLEISSSNLQSLSVNCNQMGYFKAVDSIISSRVSLSTPSIYGNIYTPTQTQAVMLEQLAVPTIEFPLLLTMTSLGFIRTQVTYIIWPLLISVDSIWIANNIARHHLIVTSNEHTKNDDTPTVGGELVFPLSTTTVGELKMGGAMGWTRLSLGGIQQLGDFTIDRSDVITIDAPNWIHGHTAFIQTPLLRSIATAPLVITSSFGLYVTAAPLSLTGLQLRSTGDFLLEGGNITGFEPLHMLQCTKAEITMTSCCPDLTKFTGDCFRSTSLDCQDCLTWTSMSPSSGPISGGQVVTLEYQGVLKAPTVLLYFNNDAAMWCTQVTNRYAVHCITTPVTKPCNVSVSLVNGRSAPILLPFQYRYVNWEDWAPVAAPSRIYNYETSGIPGLPADRSDDAAMVSRTIIISTAIALGVVTLIWLVFSCGCPHQCKNAAGIASSI
jgi:hypothetical protein